MIAVSDNTQRLRNQGLSLIQINRPRFGQQAEPASGQALQRAKLDLTRDRLQPSDWFWFPTPEAVQGDFRQAINAHLHDG